MDSSTITGNHLWSDDDVNTFSMELIEQALQGPCNEVTVMYFQAIDIVLCYARVHNRWPTHADVESQGYTSHMPLKMACTTIVTWLCSAHNHRSLDFHLRLLHRHAEKILDNIHPWASPFESQKPGSSTPRTKKGRKKHSCTDLVIEDANHHGQLVREQQQDMPDLRSPELVTAEEFASMIEHPAAVNLTSSDDARNADGCVGTNGFDNFINNTCITPQVGANDSVLPGTDCTFAATFMSMNTPSMPAVATTSPSPVEADLMIKLQDYCSQYSDMEIINDDLSNNTGVTPNIERSSGNTTHDHLNTKNCNDIWPATDGSFTSPLLPTTPRPHTVIDNFSQGPSPSPWTLNHQEPWQLATSPDGVPTTPGFGGVFGGPAGFRQVSSTTTVTTDYLVPCAELSVPPTSQPSGQNEWNQGTFTPLNDFLDKDGRFEDVQLDSDTDNAQLPLH